VRLAGLIDWERFASAFGSLYREGVGRPGLPTRLMVGLHLIQHMDGLSDEAVCARFLDSPYVQLFFGETHFQHALPLDRSSMTRWRQRIGAERLELLLAETLATAERAGAAEAKHFARVTVDPNTTAAWTPAAVNAVRAEVEIVA
jgi:IS5 family transposase